MSKDEVRSRTASVEEVEDDGFSVFSGDVQAAAAAGERLFGDLAAAGSPWSGSRFGAEAVSDDSGDESDGSRGLTGARRRLEEQVKERAAALRDMAATWQEASRMDIAVHLKRGCFPRVGADRQPVVPERVFSCGRTFNVTSLEEGGGVYEAIRRGKVMANVIGATGIGKSTAFGAKIGVKCGARVLQVAPDTVLAAEHGKALSSILAPSRMWPTEKGAALVLMTPEQFCGRFFGDGWDIMLSCFDVVMVDEAHIPAKYQYGIRAAFSSKDVGNTSLLLLTATAADQADMQSTRDTPEYTPRLLEDIVKDDGFLDGSFCVDRSVFLVESDERLRRVMGPLIAQGVEVIALESNASAAMVDEARRRLQADSATVRILLAHNRFGTGYNLPLERVVTTGLTRVLRERDGEFSWGAVPLTAPEVKQHLARAGRGICQNARKGVVLLPQKDLAPPQKLSKHEEFDTFVLLTAMGIEPCARLRKVVSAEVPMGLSRRVAVGLLQYPTLPPRLLVRFLAADGRFPPAYYKALKGFSTVSDSATLISAFDEPTHYAEWPAVSTFSVIDKDDGSLTRVPVKCTGELAAQLVFVCAAAQGQYKPEPVPQYFDDGYESGPETRKASATVVYRVGHRNPLLVAPAPVEEVGSSRGFEYSYDVPLDDQAAYGRRAGLVVPQLVTEHLRGDGFELGVPTVEHFTDAKGVARVRLVFADGSPVLVHSPGGSTVMSFPAKLWRELIAGDPLDLQSFKAFVKYVGTFVESFCESSAFSHWSPVWLTVLRSLTRVDVIRYIKEKDLAPYVMTMCTKLWERYVRGMHLAVSVSHTSRKWWRRLVNGYDESRVRKKGAAVGEAPIVQTQDFKERLYAIREAFAVALSAMEAGGFYSPGAVSSLQNVLPVSRRLGNRVFDAVRDGSAYPRLTHSTSPDWLGEKDHLLNRFG